MSVTVATTLFVYWLVAAPVKFALGGSDGGFRSPLAFESRQPWCLYDEASSHRLVPNAWRHRRYALSRVVGRHDFCRHDMLMKTFKDLKRRRILLGSPLHHYHVRGSAEGRFDDDNHGGGRSEPADEDDWRGVLYQIHGVFPTVHANGRKRTGDNSDDSEASAPRTAYAQWVVSTYHADVHRRFLSQLTSSSSSARPCVIWLVRIKEPVTRPALWRLYDHISAFSGSRASSSLSSPSSSSSSSTLSCEPSVQHAIPHHAYAVRGEGSPRFLQHLEKGPGVMFVGLQNPLHKLESSWFVSSSLSSSSLSSSSSSSSSSFNQSLYDSLHQMLYYRIVRVYTKILKLFSYAFVTYSMPSRRIRRRVLKLCLYLHPRPLYPTSSSSSALNVNTLVNELKSWSEAEHDNSKECSDDDGHDNYYIDNDPVLNASVRVRVRVRRQGTHLIHVSIDLFHYHRQCRRRSRHIELKQRVHKHENKGQEQRRRRRLVDRISWEKRKKEHVRAVTKKASDRIFRLLTHVIHDSRIHAVRRVHRLRLQNKYARYVVQGNRLNVTRVWQHQLHGEGEVVAVGDTGVDSGSCFFHDSNRPVPYNRVDTLHRKIILYVEVGDGSDTAAGHGTHVAGSIAGNVQIDHTASTSSSTKVGGESLQSVLEPYNGMAYNAKLAVYDFKRGNSETLLVPGNLYEAYYRDARNRAGAFICSNSWGSADGGYGTYSKDTDRFVSDHPDFLPVFAAGNYGRRGFHSIAAPAGAKNALTIGSSRSMAESFFELGKEEAIHITRPQNIRGIFRVIPAEKFGTPFNSKLRFPPHVRGTLAWPEDACEPLSRYDGDSHASIAQAKAYYGNTFVFARRGKCHFTIKARHIQDAGGLMMIVVESEDTVDPSIMTGADTSISIPSVMMRKDQGQPVLRALRRYKTYEFSRGLSSPSSLLSPTQPADASSSGKRNATENMNADEDRPENVFITAPLVWAADVHNPWTLSHFSSRGPTIDGRIKPDVLVPGEFITSVRSTGTTAYRCSPEDLLPREGTSMAAPIAAGTVALVRQYFREGYYPSGRPTSKDKRTPSAALLKAVMIQGGTPVSGSVKTGGRAGEDIEGGSSSHSETIESVTRVPSMYQGYGRAQLNTVLYFALNHTQESKEESKSSVLDAHVNKNDGTEDRHASSLEDEDAYFRTISYRYDDAYVRRLSFSLRPRLFVHDGPETRLEVGQIHSYCYRLRMTNSSPSSSGASAPMYPFKATLVWTDPPSALTSGVLLVNDLDLAVIHYAQKRVYRGNNHTFVDEAGNTHAVWDSLNNVEQVTLTPFRLAHRSGDDTVLVVRVRANIVAGSDTQAYALVVNGQLEELPMSDARCHSSSSSSDLHSVCPSGCGAKFTPPHGYCTKLGVCQCRQGVRTGAACSITAVNIVDVDENKEVNSQLFLSQNDTATSSAALPHYKVTATVASRGWVFFAYTWKEDVLAERSGLRPGHQGLHVRLVRVDGGDPDLYADINAFPTLRRHRWVSQEDDIKGRIKSEVFVTRHAVGGRGDGQDGNDQPGRARIIIGVYGYCCRASKFELHVKWSATDGPVPSELGRVAVAQPRKHVNNRAYGCLIVCTRVGWFNVLASSLVILVVVLATAWFCYVCHEKCNSSSSSLAFSSSTSAGDHGGDKSGPMHTSPVKATKLRRPKRRKEGYQLAHLNEDEDEDDDSTMTMLSNNEEHSQMLAQQRHGENVRHVAMSASSALSTDAAGTLVAIDDDEEFQFF